MSQSEYQLLQEQIKGLTTLVNAQFQGTHDRLDKINGKVAKHEEQITEALIERAKNREEQKHIVEGHVLNCPQASKIEKLEKNLEDVNFFIRHPKLFIAGMAVIIILLLGTFLENDPLKVFRKEEPKIEQIVTPPNG